eukprot:5647628-Pleurochrysis_carterae.AAC.1
MSSLSRTRRQACSHPQRQAFCTAHSAACVASTSSLDQGRRARNDDDARARDTCGLLFAPTAQVLTMKIELEALRREAGAHADARRLKLSAALNAAQAEAERRNRAWDRERAAREKRKAARRALEARGARSQTRTRRPRQSSCARIEAVLCALAPSFS